LSARIVTSVEANTIALVQLAGATVRAHAPEALAAGTVMLIARGESLKLLPHDAAGSNLVPCTIRRRQYLGARTTYTVEIAGDAAGYSVRVETHDDAKHWAVGERAQLQFDSEKTLVVAS
jgi:iron(III) transport system ATP-binding protein